MSLLKNFATVGGATASSRVLGFVRDMFIAAALGSGPVAEAFFVAQRLPNLFRRLFAEGAFASAFVPLFAKTYEADGPEEARRFGEESLAALAFALIVATIAAEIGMALLTYALAPGFVADPAKFDLAVLLGRIAFPYLFLISIVSLFSGALNGVGRFAAAAFAPSLLNGVLIAALIFVFLTGEVGTVTAGVMLTTAITIGGVIQLAFLYYACHRAGISLKPRMPRLTPGVRRLLRLGGPSIVAGGIVQINIVVGTIVASLEPGAVSWLYYADRLYQLPLGIVGIAIGVVLLPDLARALRAGRDDIADHTQNRALEFAAALTLPAAVALAVIPGPIIAVLFQRGAFTAADTAATAPALAAYAVGLPAFVAIKVFQPGYFAREDTKTPMWYGGVSMVVNVVAAFGLFFAFGHVGIAAATSLAAWVNTGLLVHTLHKRGHMPVDAALRKRLPLLALAAVLMGVGLYAAAWLLAPYVGDGRLLVRVVVIGALVLIGLLLFLAFCQATGAVDFREIFPAAPRAALTLLRACAGFAITPAASPRSPAMTDFIPRVFSGVQPTGNLHLGNYLGAIKRFVELQATQDCIYCVVDLHAITVPIAVWGGPKELASATRQVTAAFIAAGIDPVKHIVFNQSQVAAHAELAWVLNCVARLGWLNRMTQFKEKAGKDRENASIGLYDYPVLMAADILVYLGTHVPVGEDQKQHLELARDIATKFNNDFAESIAEHGYGDQFFPITEPLITGEATRVMSLRDGTKKMSKSDPSDYSRINLTDDAETITLKLRKAKTDPEPLPRDIEGLKARPEADNLVGIYAALADVTKEAVLRENGGAQFSQFKPRLADLAVEKLSPIAGEMRRLLADPAHIDRILADGAERAGAIAEKTIAGVKDVLGFVRKK